MDNKQDLGMVCEWCGDVFRRCSRGRVPKFCSDSCRQRFCRARKSGGSGSTFPKRFLEQERWTRAKGKRPFRVDGFPASSTDSSGWSDFVTVSNSGVGDGFGVMLGDGLGCYDFDDCFSGGVLKPEILEFIRNVPERIIFTERSVSGRGLHVFFECASDLPGYRRGGVERYSHSRFIRVTFDSYRVRP